jgi:hypothetical protein
MSKKIIKASIDNSTIYRFGTEIPKTIAEFNVLIDVLKSFGILAVYQQLDYPEILPVSCLKRASRSLDLMAYHGDKWLFETWFVPELERLRLRHGKVRFLISDSINTTTLNKCQELIKEFPKVFSVRLYQETSIFRTIIIDDAYLLLGHYGYEVIEQDGKNAKGWKSPQLFIEDNKHWSLLIPFKELFTQCWDKAQEIAAIIDSPSNTVIKREFHPSKHN